MGVHGDPFFQHRREGPRQRRGQQQAGRQAGGSVPDKNKGINTSAAGWVGDATTDGKFRSGRVDTKKIHIRRIYE